MKMNLKKRVLISWLVVCLMICLVLVGVVGAEIIPYDNILTHDYDYNDTLCKYERNIDTEFLGGQETLAASLVYIETYFDWEPNLVDNKCCEPKDEGFLNQRTQDAVDNVFLCDSNQDWKHAGTDKFVIHTIENKFDLVSNSQQWFKCDESNLYQGIGEPTDSEKRAKAAQFLCVEVDDDDHEDGYGFLQCCDESNNAGDERNCNDAGPNPDNTKDFGESTTIVLETEVPETTTFPTQTFPSTDLDDFYPFSSKNWKGADALEIFFSVEKNWDFELALIGLHDQILFKDRLVNYLVDEPGYGKKMHAIIPIKGWRNVEGFKIFFDTDDNQSYYQNNIEIEKMFLRPANKNELKYCSSARYKINEFENVWIDDLDDNRLGFAFPNQQPEIAGELACNKFGYTWTGSQCCGDDLNETFRGEIYEDSLGGCWAGEYLADNAAVMDISYMLEFEQEDKKNIRPLTRGINLTIAWTDRFKTSVFNHVHRWAKDDLFGTFCCPAGWHVECQDCWQITDVDQCENIMGDCWYPSEFGAGSCLFMRWYRKDMCLDIFCITEKHAGIMADVLTRCVLDVPQTKTISVNTDFSENPKEIDLAEIIGDDWLDDSEIRIVAIGPAVEVGPQITEMEVYFLSKESEGDKLITNNINDPLIIKNNNQVMWNKGLFWTERQFAYSNWEHLVGSCGSSDCELEYYLVCPSGYSPVTEGGYCTGIEIANLNQCEHQSQTGNYPGCIPNDCYFENDRLRIQWEKDETTRHLRIDLDARTKCFKDVQYEEEEPKEKTMTHSCTTNVCDIPLAGYPPYRIENLHPDDYDLYFVDGFGEKTLINDEKRKFDVRGNLQAVKVPLQVLFFNDSLWGCNQSDYMERSFIESVGICEVKGESFCAGQAGWGFGFSEEFDAWERNTLKQALAGPNTSAPNYFSFSCCPADACWNGTSCVGDMSGKLPRPQYNHSCIDGSWELTPPILTWDKARQGFCPYPGDCLVELNGNGSLNYDPDSWYTSMDFENRPICIADQQFIADNFCENNIWESRTKKIAIQLLNLINNTGDINDYSLYCDYYDGAFYGSDLNNSNIIEYIIGPRGGFFNQPQPFYPETSTNAVNHFCILNYNKIAGASTGTRRVIATSLNIPIDHSSSSFLYALGQTDPNYCDDAIGGQDVFTACGPNNVDDSLWYSDDLNSIVMGSATIEMNGLGFFQSIIDWFKNPIQNIINWILERTPTGQVQKDYSFVSNTTQMKYFYSAARPGGKKVTAVMEQINDSRIILAKYENFSIDMCAFVMSAAQGKGITINVTLQGAVCNRTGNDYNVLVDDSIVPGLWRELTAGLTIT